MTDEDPAKFASNKDKRNAFEWLRSVALSDRQDSWHAAVMMREIARLRDLEKGQ